MNESTGSERSEQALRDLFGELRRAAAATPSKPPGDPIGEETPPLERGAVVGRYLVRDLVGEGAVGVVYLADDPELRREVALKVLRARAAGPVESTRLQHEAQALARLKDPNVIAVHDIGTLPDGRVWIAMEFVAGATLRDWANTPRPWPEVLRVLQDAARGLAAVHAAGFVHRDVKPDNVMIGDDGRVRVMDFGLAHQRVGSMTEEMARATAPSGPDAPFNALARLTRTGIIPGTPAYMAPEQWQGRDAGQAADQFAWSVMAWELLHGARPFTGRTQAALELAILRGPPPRPPRSPVPGWLHRIIVRGLAVDPTRRFATMDHLLAALARDPTRKHRMWLGGGLLAAAITGWFATQYVEHRRTAASCVAAGETITQIWNDDRRRALQDSLASTGVGFAVTSGEKMLPWIDAYAGAWRAARTGVCHRENVTRTLDPVLAAEARACLDERREYLDTLLGEFIDTSPDLAERRHLARTAVSAMTTLPRIDACSDLRRLRARPQITDLRMLAEIREVRGKLARAFALDTAARFDEAVQLVDEAAHEARVLGWQPLIAEAGLRQGKLLFAVENYQKSEAVLEQAFLAAGEAGHDEIFAESAAFLTLLVGFYQAPRYAEGIRWGQIALMLLARAGGTSDAFLRARTLAGLGTIFKAQGEYAKAAEYHRQASELVQEAAGKDHPNVSAYLNSLGADHYELGEYAQARELLTQALRIAENALGPDHLDVGLLLISLGSIVSEQGAYRESIAYAERALRIIEGALGPENRQVALILGNLGLNYVKQGDPERAIPLLERGLKIRQKIMGKGHPDVARGLSKLADAYEAAGIHGPAIAAYRDAIEIYTKANKRDHPDLATPLTGLGDAYRGQGQLGLAAENYERALAVLRAGYSPTHPSVAVVLNKLGAVSARQQRHERALQLHSEALAIAEGALGADHPSVAVSLGNLGIVHVDMGQPAKARALLERAVTILEAKPEDPFDLAHARFVLARALWSEPGERARARSLAVLAQDTYGRAGRARAAELAETTAWLNEHVP